MRCHPLAIALTVCAVAAAEEEPGWASLPSPSIESYVHLEVGYAPWVDVTADKDYLEPDDGVRFDARVGGGPGVFARISGGSQEVSLGLSYRLSQHLERTYDALTTLHLGALELEVHGGFPERGPVQLTGGVAIGVGAAVFDFDRGYHDSGGAAALLRARVGLRAYGRVEVFFEAGGFVWGTHREAFGWGGWAGPGVGLHF
ncbi:MAG: hypothetical protein R3F62_14575 [Planctomycetota bacterium]